MKKLISKIKNSKKLQIITVVVILIVAFIIYSLASVSGYNGLGKNAAQKSSSVTENAIDSIGDDYGMYDEAEVNEESKSSSSDFVSAEDENQKLVYSGNVSIYTDDIYKTYEELLKKMKEFEGKLEYINEYTDSKEISIRVKKDNFMKLYESLNDIKGDITNASLSVDDMTKEYVNNSRKIDALQAEYDDLKDLMKKAENVEEILTIKDRLYELQYQLDSLEQSNNDIDYDAEYSILHIYIEKANSSIGYKVPYYKQIKEAFNDSIEIIKDFILFLIRIWWLILAVLVIIYRKKIFKKLKNNKDFDLSKKENKEKE